jgi:hypothetical protein
MSLDLFSVSSLLRTSFVAASVALMTGVGFSLQVELRTPWIDTKAPGAFDEPSPTGASTISAHYRVDSTVFLPLWFVSVPLVSRDGVGTASAVARDLVAQDGGELRTYEFFAASRPERARGLNRLGFLREAVWLERDGVHWTAHLGVVSSSREATLEEAEARLDQPDRVEAYSVLDGFTDRARSRSAIVHLDLEGTWLTADALYDDLRPHWETAEPDDEPVLENESGRVYREPVGFLGAIQHSLRVAAADVAQYGSPRQFRYRFVHRSKLFFLDLEGHSLDNDRRRRYAEAGLVEPGVLVHKLDYRIVNSEGDSVQSFELWAKLLATGSDALAAPILPLAFEFRARSFLKLKAVRVPGSVRSHSEP